MRKRGNFVGRMRQVIYPSQGNNKQKVMAAIRKGPQAFGLP
jgi:hypothetical protein